MSYGKEYCHMTKRLLSYQTRRAASASTLTAPADSASLSKPSFRLGLNQIQPRQCTSTAGAAFLVLRGEEPINQTLEGVYCNDFEHVPESPHEHTSFSGPA